LMPKLMDGLCSSMHDHATAHRLIRARDDPAS
jgi:hypothetical protein